MNSCIIYLNKNHGGDCRDQDARGIAEKLGFFVIYLQLKKNGLQKLYTAFEAKKLHIFAYICVWNVQIIFPNHINLCSISCLFLQECPRGRGIRLPNMTLRWAFKHQNSKCQMIEGPPKGRFGGGGGMLKF